VLKGAESAFKPQLVSQSCMESNIALCKKIKLNTVIGAKLFINFDYKMSIRN